MLKTFRLSVHSSGAWRVDMPTYRMMPGTFGPAVAGIIDRDGILQGVPPDEAMKHAPYVTVELPDDTPLDLLGHVDAAAMRQRYGKHTHFGADSWAPPSEVKG